MISYEVEWPQIKAEAAKIGLDPYFIWAIRRVENGDPGKEYGVLSVSAPTYADQLRVCCSSVRHRLVEFSQDKNPALTNYTCPNGDVVLIYSQQFVQYLGKIYAPIGAGNDPENKNLNWVRDVAWNYIHGLDAAHNGVQR